LLACAIVFRFLKEWLLGTELVIRLVIPWPDTSGGGIDQLEHLKFTVVQPDVPSEVGAVM